MWLVGKKHTICPFYTFLLQSNEKTLKWATISRKMTIIFLLSQELDYKGLSVAAMKQQEGVS